MGLKRPKLSVAIVTYNHGKFIADCLNSFVNGKYDFDFEVVIGDDCSTDNNREIIMGFVAKNPDIFDCLFYEKNIGGAANFSKVLDACKGEYIAYLDGDDMMLPGKLEKQVKFLDNHPECAIVAHNLGLVDEKGEQFGLLVKENLEGIFDINFLLEKGTFFGHSSKMFRSSSRPPEGVDFSLKVIGDWLYSLKNARCGKIGYINEVLGLYRKHRMGSTTLNELQQEFLLQDKLHIINTAASYPGVKRDSVAIALRMAYFVAANNFMVQGNYLRFYECVVKSYKIGIGFVNRFHRFLYVFRNFPRFSLWVINFKLKNSI